MIALYSIKLHAIYVQIYIRPSTPTLERKADLELINRIPPQDRKYDPDDDRWTIYHPRKYVDLIPAVKQGVEYWDAKTTGSFVFHQTGLR